MKILKCFLCKEHGHEEADCEKDPNLRTNKDIEQEYDRILLEKQKKEVDQALITANMLEKLTLLSNERTMTKLLTHDDFNYVPFNENIFNLNLPLGEIEESSESNEEDENRQSPDDSNNSKQNQKNKITKIIVK